MLEGLADIHPNLMDWRRQAKTRAAAYKLFCAMPPSLPELESILRLGRHFKSASHELSPELGYSATAWNGLDEPQSMSLHARVGGYYYRWLYPNRIEIEGLRKGNELVDATLLKRALLAIATCWDADWGVVETWDYKGRIVDFNDKPLVPYGSWLTYLSRALAVKMAPPSDVCAERTRDGGLFLLVSQEPFDVANSTHVARLDAVQKSLAPVNARLQRPLTIRRPHRARCHSTATSPPSRRCRRRCSTVSAAAGFCTR
jgi:hypothetical protein